MRENLEEQYYAAVEMESQLRSQIYNRDGKLVSVIKGPNGQPLPNPLISEWRSALNTVQNLARELGIIDESDYGPLAVATDRNDLLGSLDALAMVLAESIDLNRGHGLAALSREYRETIMAADEVRKSKPQDDEIGRLVSEGAARAHRLGLSVV